MEPQLQPYFDAVNSAKSGLANAQAAVQAAESQFCTARDALVQAVTAFYAVPGQTPAPAAAPAAPAAATTTA